LEQHIVIELCIEVQCNFTERVKVLPSGIFGKDFFTSFPSMFHEGLRLSSGKEQECAGK
jgi:hypothetical protein